MKEYFYSILDKSPEFEHVDEKDISKIKDCCWYIYSKITESENINNKIYIRNAADYLAHMISGIYILGACRGEADTYDDLAHIDSYYYLGC